MEYTCSFCGQAWTGSGEIGSDGLCDICYQAIHDKGLAAVKHRGEQFRPAAKDLIRDLGMGHLLDE